MLINAPILSEGIPPGAIFGVIVFLLWGVTAIFGKAKTPELKKPSGTMVDLAEIRRRVLEEQAKGKQDAQQQVVAMRQKAKQKQKRKPTPPPLPTRVAAPVQQSIASPMAARAAAPAPLVPLTAHRAAQSETAKNIRMLLQRNGVKEAFVLAEIFGKPRGLE